MKKKVYCIDCKWFYCDIAEACNAPQNQAYNSTYKRKRSWFKYLSDPYIINSRNNCGMYKRKWWKFWI